MNGEPSFSSRRDGYFLIVFQTRFDSNIAFLLCVEILIVDHISDHAKRKKNAKQTSDIEMITYGLHGSNAK